MNAMAMRPEVLPFLAGTVLLFGVVAGVLRWRGFAGKKAFLGSSILACLVVAYLLYFFRDPERTPPGEGDVVVAGADGTVASVTPVYEGRHLKTPCVRISIFLSLFDVHVNRAPISGTSTFLGYSPGKRLFTFQEKSSDVNQHNTILIVGEGTRCLVCQIVGPVCRRVVYWPAHDKPVEVFMGERIGMMKFGSRLDMYFPAGDVTVLVTPGARVRAGETVVARLNRVQPPTLGAAR